MTVLFDLDGTLLNTAPDLYAVMNRLLEIEHRPKITSAIEDIHPHINLGMKALLSLLFDCENNPKELDRLRIQFENLYAQGLAEKTLLFPGMETLLDTLDKHNLPWGIVTNKRERFTLPLLKQLNLHHRPKVIVCGDTLTHAKPHPAPILHACARMNIDPTQSFYVGDAYTDVLAGNAAGLQTIVALFGYIPTVSEATSWPADHFVHHPNEILPILERTQQ